MSQKFPKQKPEARRSDSPLGPARRAPAIINLVDAIPRDLLT